MSDEPQTSNKAKNSRQQAWSDLWEMLDEVDEQPGLYDHMTDDWLDELRQGWDDPDS